MREDRLRGRRHSWEEVEDLVLLGQGRGGEVWERRGETGDEKIGIPGITTRTNMGSQYYTAHCIQYTVHCTAV